MKGWRTEGDKDKAFELMEAVREKAEKKAESKSLDFESGYRLGLFVSHYEYYARCVVDPQEMTPKEAQLVRAMAAYEKEQFGTSIAEHLLGMEDNDGIGTNKQ